MFWKKFRNDNLKAYGLYQSHYLSAPALSEDAMFNMKKKLSLNLIQICSLEKVSETKFLTLYDKAKNKYLKYYDPKQESKYIIYLEVNTLYGYVMFDFLPTSGFKWIHLKEFDLNKCTSNSSKGCVLEVDLEYPKELHKLHNDYPLAPDKTEIRKEHLQL